MKKYFVLAAIAFLLLGLGCSNATSPLVPDKGADVNTFFSQFDLSSPVVGEFVYSDYDGNVIATGQVGKNADGFYVINERDAQKVLDLRPLGLVDISITYNNPAGTIDSGPNAGLPYYYVGQTVDYDINVTNMAGYTIGDAGCSCGLTAEMRYATWDSNGDPVPGNLMPGSPIYSYTGLIYVGVNVFNDLYYIPGGTTPGLNVTTVRLDWDTCNGLFTLLYFDDVAGVWDPK